MPSQTEDRRVTGPEDHFSLRQFTQILDAFVPPDESAVSKRQGAWREEFAVYTCPHGHASQVGRLTLARTPQTDGRVQISATVDRNLGPGGRHITKERIICRESETVFPAPLSWELETRGLTSSGAENPEYRLQTAVRILGRKFVVETRGGRKIREADLPPGLYASRTMLLDAVRRLPRTRGWHASFTFLRADEIPLPGHRIAYRGSTDLLLGAKRAYRYVEAKRLEAGVIFRPQVEYRGGRVVRLHTFEHVGPGLVPFVYWVDEAGRLFFAVSGLEAWVRIPTAPPPAVRH